MKHSLIAMVLSLSVVSGCALGAGPLPSQDEEKTAATEESALVPNAVTITTDFAIGNLGREPGPMASWWTSNPPCLGCVNQGTVVVSVQNLGTGDRGADVWLGGPLQPTFYDGYVHCTFASKDPVTHVLTYRESWSMTAAFTQATSWFRVPIPPDMTADMAAPTARTPLSVVCNLSLSSRSAPWSSTFEFFRDTVLFEDPDSSNNMVSAVFTQ